MSSTNIPRLLVIMGSGETAPTMVSTHRSLVARLPQPVSAAVLDTPYGFQENAPELAQRAVTYFKTSINIDIAIAGLTRLQGGSATIDPVEIERGLRTISDANYVFAGPGSPTYALRQWKDTPVVSLLTHKLLHGGIVTFASAAALTLGRFTVPVYEVYKAGEEPRWEDGLNLLSAVGINAVVIPHYDNAEGGHHDTRFCYLGERRLSFLEALLPSDCYVLGVDEHTGLVIDLDAGSATVVGNGTVTIRIAGQSTEFTTGSTLSLAYLQSPWSNLNTDSIPNKQESVTATLSSTTESLSLGAITQRCNEEFKEALILRDANRAVRVALELETAITSWSADTLQSTEADDARATLRAMISALGDAAVNGVRDPREVMSPLVEALLTIRDTVRAEKRFDLSDLIRDLFTAQGIEVQDTPSGVQWSLGES